MSSHISLVVLGLVLLVVGGECLVRGASGLAILARVTPAVVGLTIVAAGTSTPELVVSTQAALAGSPGLAVGNVVGSNIFNIGLILGLTALLRPLSITGSAVRLEWPVMMLASIGLYALGGDLRIDRLEGAFFLSAMIAFTAYVIWIARRAVTGTEREDLSSLATASFGRQGGAAWVSNGLAVLLAIGLLWGGSTSLVRGAVGMAAALGVSETVIGLTIVAAGTSAPELITSLVAAFRGRDDIAVANVVGSGIFNVLGICGVTALIHPLSIPSEIQSRDMLWMLGISLLLFPLMKSKLRIARWEGAVLLAVYAAYLGVLLRGAL